MVLSSCPHYENYIKSNGFEFYDLIVENFIGPKRKIKQVCTFIYLVSISFWKKHKYYRWNTYALILLYAYFQMCSCFECSYSGVHLHACLQCIFFGCNMNHMQDHIKESGHFLGRAHCFVISLYILTLINSNNSFIFRSTTKIWIYQMFQMWLLYLSWRSIG